MIGQTVSHYKILEKLGEGGMGVVYKAHDTKLDREVAIKVLPEALAADRERLARFEREARLLATLNHPNIAAIYGIEEAGGKPYLVLELVAGRTLADQLRDGPLPPAEALDLCRQIAEGLEAAHEKGIIHRDLKPANIKITPEGKAKILDFGLAKAYQGETAPVDASKSPTLSEQMTRVGVILGTAAYMSPEQAKGKTVDKRTDIWAFGCVLYEMLAGRGAFAAESVTETLAAITRDEPDWSALPATTPVSVRQLLDRCLRKDPRQRLRDIGDIRLVLDEVAGASGIRPSSGTTFGEISPARVGARVWRVAHWIITVACLLLLAYISVALLTGGWSTSPRVMRLSLTHPLGGRADMAAISPNGRRVVYAAPPEGGGEPLLWVRDLDSFEPRHLAGTEGALHPFWSPDSQWVGFGTGAALKKVNVESGAVQEIGKLTTDMFYGGTWSKDGTIVACMSDILTPLLRISSAGDGQFEPATSFKAPGVTHLWPSFLPDGRHFLFLAKDYTRSAETSQGGIYVGSLDTREDRSLLPEHSNAVFAPPGYLIFQRNGKLMAAAFDPTTLAEPGNAQSLNEQVDIDASMRNVALSAAKDGTVVVGSGGIHALKRRLVWVDRNRTDGEAVGKPDYYSLSLSLSPNGRTAAVGIEDLEAASPDIWLLDSQTGAGSRFTTSPAWDGWPRWSPKGTLIAFATNENGWDDVYVGDIQGGKAQPVTSTPNACEQPTSWSPDEKYLLIQTYGSTSSNGQKFNSWDANLSYWSWSEKVLKPFLTSPSASESRGIFSPDGRFVAYTSNKTGRDEVWVTPFEKPLEEEGWQITFEGAKGISWRKDGHEILVATLAGNLVGVPVSPDTGRRVGSGSDPVLVPGLGSDAPHAAANADHTRFLVKIPVDAGVRASEVRILFGWAEALRQGQLPWRR